MREPGEWIAALLEPAIAVDDAEQERAKADQDSSDDDEMCLVASVQEASDDGRENENHERLRGSDEVEEVAGKAGVSQRILSLRAGAALTFLDWASSAACSSWRRCRRR